MPVRTLRGKRGCSRDLGTDRAVAAAVFLAVTILLILIGFTGPSLELRLPGFHGWIYVGLVILVATMVLVRLIGIGGKPKDQIRPALKKIDPGRNESNKRR